MATPHSLDFLRISSNILVALDSRPFHFALQPYHHLVRLTHILSMAAFFGGIALLDLRLMGWSATLSLRTLSRNMLPLLYGLFAVTIVTGAALFFYDPVKVGSHAYFTLKLILTTMGLANAAVFHRGGYALALSVDANMPMRARIAGGMSLALWIGVVVCACLNVEAEPKVLLR